ncbi:hypothetical protein [Streptomyces sp. NBC_01244]|uniref:hypothetical protein n=1 Tax=Streptomyces sp. NBC_01244 TaxID=2903797 RepID=UPI002E0D31BD|nr:hypothetical protein OG247_31555 [Streptomyces sp. NBC_01244]
MLILLGFVATSWIITITLSTADASVHVVENPFFPAVLHGHEVALTIALLLVLGGVFLLGFREAVSVAIPLVVVFLVLNAVVIGIGLTYVFTTPGAWSAWTDALAAGGGGFGDLLGPALLVLVLGLSGFETGVSMMPLVAADGADEEQRLRSRIRNTRRLRLHAPHLSMDMLTRRPGRRSVPRSSDHEPRKIGPISHLQHQKRHQLYPSYHLTPFGSLRVGPAEKSADHDETDQCRDGHMACRLVDVVDVHQGEDRPQRSAEDEQGIGVALAESAHSGPQQQGHEQPGGHDGGAELGQSRP